MEKLFNKKVLDSTNQSMKEINSELDLEYCKKHKITFPNNEVDMVSVTLFSKEVMDKAYEILHPET